MKVIKQNAEQIKETNPLKKIELIARTCYKSENLIKDGSDAKFVQGLIKAKHYAMLEHAIFHFETSGYNDFPWYADIFKQFAKVSMDITASKTLVTMNLRTIIELLDLSTRKEYRHDIQFECFKDLMSFALPKEILDASSVNLTKSDIEINGVKHVDDEYIKSNYSENVYRKHCFKTFKLTTNRAIANELVRHRLCSFAQESTRYCNYSKNKFGNEIKVIEPYGLHDNETWRKATERVEKAYFELLKVTKPEIARDVLPLDLATELTVTANLDEWEHIINLRYNNTTGKAHPQVVELMGKIVKDFKEREF